MIHYPKAELRPIDRDGGEMQGGPPRGVWHTTETNPANNYDRDYYHLNLAMVDGAPKWVQLIDLGRASRALRRPGDVQTNRQGDYCINVSISGYARDAGNWPAAIYDEMAELMVWCEAELGIPAAFPYRFVGGEGYGESGAVRLAVQDWLDLSGWVGHQHVPYNTHWDPGRIPVAELEAKIAMADKPYHYDDVPNWAKQAWQKAFDAGLVTEDTIPGSDVPVERLFVFLARAGVI